MEDKKVLLQRWITPSGKLVLYLQIRDPETNQLVKEFNLLEEGKQAIEYLINGVKVISGDLFTLSTMVVEFGDLVKTFKWDKELNFKDDNIIKIKEEIERRFTEIIKWKNRKIRNEVIELNLPNDYDLENYNFEEL